jgi:hypothetical protein
MSVAKIKEFKAKDENELLDLVTLWPKFDEEWHRGGEWIEPKDKTTSTKSKTVTNRKRAYKARQTV